MRTTIRLTVSAAAAALTGLALAGCGTASAVTTPHAAASRTAAAPDTPAQLRAGNTRACRAYGPAWTQVLLGDQTTVNGQKFQIQVYALATVADGPLQAGLKNLTYSAVTGGYDQGAAAVIARQCKALGVTIWMP